MRVFILLISLVVPAAAQLATVTVRPDLEAAFTKCREHVQSQGVFTPGIGVRGRLFQPGWHSCAIIEMMHARALSNPTSAVTSQEEAAISEINLK